MKFLKRRKAQKTPESRVSRPPLDPSEMNRVAREANASEALVSHDQDALRDIYDRVSHAG